MLHQQLGQPAYLKWLIRKKRYRLGADQRFGGGKNYRTSFGLWLPESFKYDGIS
jgi:hypothetical protein